MWFRVVFQDRFEIVVKIDLGFSLGGVYSIYLMLAQCLFNIFLVLLLACLVFGSRCA